MFLKGHIFTLQDEFYILNSERMLVAQINRVLAEEYKKLQWANGEMSDSLRFILAKTKLSNLNYTFNDEEYFRENYKIENYRIKSITLMIAKECNMACRYCYGEEGSYGGSGGLMNVETALKAVDFLLRQINEQEREEVEQKYCITFFGGEPLLNFSLIQEVIAYIERQPEWKKKQITYSITTNVSLLDEEKTDYLLSKKVSIVVSFDGDAKIQNYNRPLKNGADSYNVCIGNIKRLLQRSPNTCCRASLYEYGTEYEVRKALLEIGFKNIHIEKTTPSLLQYDKKLEKIKESNLFSAEEAIGELCQRVLKAVKQKNSEEVLAMQRDVKLAETINRLYIAETLQNLPVRMLGCRKYIGCHAGLTFLAVDTDGAVYVCHRFVGQQSFKLGDINQMDNLNRSFLLERPMLISNEKCCLCFAGYFCGGDCIHDNLSRTGNHRLPDEEKCLHIQRRLQYFLALYCKFSEDDKEWLKKMKILQTVNCSLDFF